MEIVGSPRRSASSGVISSETIYLMPEAVIRETVRGPFRGPVSREAQGDGLSPQILGRWGKIALGYSVSCIERINWIPQAYMRNRYTPLSHTLSAVDTCYSEERREREITEVRCTHI